MTVPCAPGTSTDRDAPWRLVIGLLGPHRRALAGYGLVLAAATALPLAGSLLRWKRCMAGTKRWKPQLWPTSWKPCARCCETPLIPMGSGTIAAQTR